ncbi:uracil-DNA glycosylase [Halorientalis regularis]|jgi:uracil-DNA glycosylase family 4|uniref:Uracil-DNA glycosylase, family 4 n=1 Tax=Halorientalis regularis TaxID=660518 RepID=A0A1G7FEA3_9EURY|nr:uracil-DNA glycosylase [Halorientalis regularis]SDE74210.1 uracil-DNA glycosylase, family 4 [Halorientalis regularis]
MDANQETVANPFGMDADCRQCPALCETRTQVVHGYGDVSADFLVLGEAPGSGADETGIPFTGDESGRAILSILSELGFVDAPDSDEPTVENVFLTTLTRCHHPERPPSDDEVRNCEGFLTAEVRMINPEVILPVGQRPLEALALEYTTKRADDFDVAADHGTTIRGRGFELVPMLPPAEQTDDQRTALLEHLASLLDRDYRQTKGRRSR